MKIKKFQGTTMSAVMREIKAELGDEAVIISTRDLHPKKPPGLLGLQHPGLFKPMLVEVTAALEVAEVLTPVFEPEKVVEPTSFQSNLAQVVNGDIYQEIQSIKAVLEDLKVPQTRPESPAVIATPRLKEPSISEAEALTLPSTSTGLHETWHEMKVMLKSMTELQRDQSPFDNNTHYFRLFEALRLAGIDQDTAKQLVKAVEESLSEEALWRPDRVEASLHETLESLIQVRTGLKSDESMRFPGPRIMTVIGPTGVGKTTTLIKIALREQKNAKVTLIALELDESGDNDSLMRHAERHGLSALRMRSWAQLGRFIATRKKSDCILVDTAGCSHLQPAGVARLKGLLALNRPLETHLVLSATTKASDLSDMVDRFSVVPIDSLLFTKMDETDTYGPLFSAMGRKRKPISFLTMGQRVPEDIEVATPKRFTRMLLSRCRAEIHGGVTQ